MKLISLIKLFFYWRKVKAQKKHVLIKKGCGYYIPVGLIGVNPIGKKEEWPMKSGKTARVKLLSFKCFRDPSDMIEESTWAFLGYVGETPVKDMKFLEFIELMEEK